MKFPKKEINLRYDKKILNLVQDKCPQEVSYLCYRGSIVSGMGREGVSDIDFIGFFFPSKYSLMGLDKIQQYEIKEGNFGIETSDYKTMFSNGGIFICDNNQDGEVDRLIFIKGPIEKPKRSFVEQECFGNSDLGTEVNLNKIEQDFQGKNPYNTRRVFDLTRKKLYDFNSNKISSLSERGLENMKNLYQKFINMAKGKFNL